MNTSINTEAQDYSVSFVICNNGYGHARRVSLVARELIRKSVRRLRFLSGLRQIEYLRYALGEFLNYSGLAIEFETEPFDRVPSPNQNYLASNDWLSISRNWIELAKGPVVSDNYVATLAEKDCLLMASFLWPEIFSASDDTGKRQLAHQERQLLKIHRPPMVCVGEMAMPWVFDFTDSVPCEWFGQPSPEQSNPYDQREGILLTAGAGDTNRETLFGLYCKLSRSNHIPLFVDSSLKAMLDQNGEPGSVLFSFAPADFCRLRLIVGRPGMGLLGDCVMNGVPIMTLCNPGEPEMIHNTMRVMELAIGQELLQGSGMEEQIAQSYFDQNGWQTHHNAIRKRPLGGEITAAKRILINDSNS